MERNVIDYFLHIPKTGGTSFASVLRGHYRPEETLLGQTWRELLEAWPVDFGAIGMACGHFGYGLHRYAVGRRMRYLTLLRNPVERVLSHWHHIKCDPVCNDWVRGSTDHSWIDDQPALFANAQARYLARYVDVPKTTARPFYYDGCHEFTHVVDWQPVFDEACAHLRDFFFVGFTEEMQRSVDRLCALMDWKPVEVPHLNRLGRPASERVPPSVVRKIELLNEWDFRLYDYARSMTDGL